MPVSPISMNSRWKSGRQDPVASGLRLQLPRNLDRFDSVRLRYRVLGKEVAWFGIKIIHGKSAPGQQRVWGAHGTSRPPTGWQEVLLDLRRPSEVWGCRAAQQLRAGRGETGVGMGFYEGYSLCEMRPENPDAIRRQIPGPSLQRLQRQALSRWKSPHHRAGGIGLAHHGGERVRSDCGVAGVERCGS